MKQFDIYSLARERERLRQRELNVYKNVVEVVKKQIERVNKYQSFLVYEVPSTTDSPSYSSLECLKYCQEVFANLGMKTRVLIEYRTLVISWTLDEKERPERQQRFVGLSLRSEMLRKKEA